MVPVISFLFLLQVIKPFVEALKQGLGAHPLSLAVAAGAVGGLFPVPGLTVLVCMAFIVPFQLNLAIVQGILIMSASGIWQKVAYLHGLLTDRPHHAGPSDKFCSDPA
jgi:uncharacterized protein (DUF2062 family)